MPVEALSKPAKVHEAEPECPDIAGDRRCYVPQIPSPDIKLRLSNSNRDLRDSLGFMHARREIKWPYDGRELFDCGLFACALRGSL